MPDAGKGIETRYSWFMDENVLNLRIPDNTLCCYIYFFNTNFLLADKFHQIEIRLNLFFKIKSIIKNRECCVNLGYLGESVLSSNVNGI